MFILKKNLRKEKVDMKYRKKKWKQMKNRINFFYIYFFYLIFHRIILIFLR